MRQTLLLMMLTMVLVIVYTFLFLCNRDECLLQRVLFALLRVPVTATQYKGDAGGENGDQRASDASHGNHRRFVRLLYNLALTA